MVKDEIDIYNERLTSTVPLVGASIRRKGAEGLAKLAENGSEKSTKYLAIAYLSTNDNTVRNIAQDALNKLKKSSSIDAYCEYVLESENPSLIKIAIEKNYEPSKLPNLALFFFILGLEEKYQKIAPDIQHQLLKQGFQIAKPVIRERALIQAKKRGYIKFLSPTIDQNSVLKPSNVKDNEWTLIIEGLFSEKEWGELWRLVFNAPYEFSIKILNGLQPSEWKPEETIKGDWERIKSHLPKEPLLPIPKICEEFTCTTINKQKSLALSPDGSLVATGGENSLYFWNIPQGSCSKIEFEKHLGIPDVSCMSFSPDGQFLAFVHDRAIKIFNLQTFQMEKIITYSALFYKSYITQLLFNPSGSILGYCGVEGKKDAFSIALLLNTTTWERVNSFGGHINEAINSIAFSQSGELFAYINSNGPIALHHILEKEAINESPGTQKNGEDLKFSPNDSLLIGCNLDSIYFWTVPDLKIIKTIKNPRKDQGGISSFEISSDCTYLVCVSQNKNFNFSDPLYTIDIIHIKTEEILLSIDSLYQSHNIAMDNKGLRFFAIPKSEDQSTGKQTIHIWYLPWTLPLSLATAKDLDIIEKIIERFPADDKSKEEWIFFKTLLKIKLGMN